MSRDFRIHGEGEEPESKDPPVSLVRSDVQLTRRQLQTLVLQELALRGNVTESCERAGVPTRRFYKWKENSPAFRRRVEAAMLEATDRLEAEARRRAVEGVEEPVGWFKGVPGGTVRRYSDALLTQLLRAHSPKFNTQNVEVRGVFAKLDMTKLTDEQIQRLANGENPLSVLGETMVARLAAMAEQDALPPGQNLNDLEPEKP